MIRMDATREYLDYLSTHGRKASTMRMPEAVSRALDAWREECPPGSLYIVASTQPKGGDYSLEPVAIGAMVRRLGKRCGVDLTTHSLRRLYACDLDAREVSPVQIAQLMRHESINTTYRCYLKPNPARLDEIVAGVGLGFRGLLNRDFMLLLGWFVSD